jgi:hypothetical protein
LLLLLLFPPQILDCENVSVESDYKNRGGLFVVIGLYYGGRPITGLHMTEIIPTNNAASWNQEITFDLPMANLPRVRFILKHICCVPFACAYRLLIS